MLSGTILSLFRFAWQGLHIDIPLTLLLFLLVNTRFELHLCIAEVQSWSLRTRLFLVIPVMLLSTEFVFVPSLKRVITTLRSLLQRTHRLKRVNTPFDTDNNILLDYTIGASAKSDAIVSNIPETSDTISLPNDNVGATVQSSSNANNLSNPADGTFSLSEYESIALTHQKWETYRNPAGFPLILRLWTWYRKYSPHNPV